VADDVIAGGKTENGASALHSLDHALHASLAGVSAGMTFAEGLDRNRDQGLRFVRRMYIPRVVGLGAGFFAVASVLYQNGAHALVWAALVFNGLVWPHLAFMLARRSAEPQRTEIRNLLADSTCGGVWIAVMGFNLLPSVLLAAMLAMDKISVGGPRLLMRAIALQLTGCVAAAVLLGVDVQPATTMVSVVGSMPLLIAYPIAVGIATYRLSRKVRDQNRLLQMLSRTDGLSGLLNRTCWVEAVSRELSRIERNGGPASLLMLDIDHFKLVNDRHGHPAGDEVIRSVATLVRATLRDYDTAGRYGGEEFGVILPDTGIECATAIAERIRMRIEAATLEREANIRCTISVGIAVATPDVRDVREWIERADRALYRAKALGRNRTVRHETGAPLAVAQIES
jgi:diguanylate cyclase